MRLSLLASAAVLALATSVPAFAQPISPPTPVPTTADGARPGNIPGTDNSLPTSNRSSNINRSDTRSPIAPRLPAPGLAEGASPAQFLTVARTALRRKRTGEAQEALERAETRLLDRSTPQGADAVDNGPMIAQISDARTALSSGDSATAIRIIDGLLAIAGSAPRSTM